MIKTTEDVYKHTKDYSTKKNEHLLVVCMNKKAEVIGSPVIAQGEVDEITVSPKDIFEYALTKEAEVIILVHNHPSGDVRPSPADVSSTQTLIEIGKIVGIPIVDHVIIAENQYFSMRESLNIWQVKEAEQEDVEELEM